MAGAIKQPRATSSPFTSTDHLTASQDFKNPYLKCPPKVQLREFLWSRRFLPSHRCVASSHLSRLLGGTGHTSFIPSNPPQGELGSYTTFSQQILINMAKCGLSHSIRAPLTKPRFNVQLTQLAVFPEFSMKPVLINMQLLLRAGWGPGPTGAGFECCAVLSSVVFGLVD